MMIHHSIQLLRELHELENEIKIWEDLTRRMGLEIDSRAILHLLLSNKMKNNHTALTDSKRVS
jgi:hypothetical protein